MRLIAENLTCVRGGRTLFRNLDFEVAAGRALLVTGPNGAGKSSLLRLLAGLLRPAAGRIALEGSEPGQPAGVSAHFIGHLDAAKGALRAAENLAFMQALLGGGGRTVAEALRAVGLDGLAEVPVRMFSAGQRRRLALARLIVAPRPLWLLDEPTTALDAEGQETFAALAAKHLAGGGIVVAATHAPLKISAQEIRLGAGGAA
ncbi:MAG: heme ABC exporter ATP-binding protein CcmA [Bradyrhizobiaceae bacterium]|nr:heme ABC exporter ATP-binding protein CcmA [Bradyrhizobiaceae bacterium]